MKNKYTLFLLIILISQSVYGASISETTQYFESIGYQVESGVNSIILTPVDCLEKQLNNLINFLIQFGLFMTALVLTRMGFNLFRGKKVDIKKTVYVIITCSIVLILVKPITQYLTQTKLKETCESREVLNEIIISSSTPNKIKIPEAVKEKDVIIQTRYDRKSDDFFKKELIKHEGYKNRFYLDTRGNITIGIGSNVSDKSKFMRLEITTLDGKILSNTEKENLYKDLTIKSMQSKQSGKKINNNSISNYKISDKEIHSTLNNQIQINKTQLNNKINNFYTLPKSAQEALIDMNLNMGNGGFSKSKWKDLYQAVEVGNWEKAAKESHRQGVGASRNQLTYEKFINAKRESNNA